MGTDTLPDIEVAPDTFGTAEADYFVATKTDRDAAGNLRTAYPSSSIVSRFTAGWANRVDDAIRALQRGFRGEVQIGVNDTPATDPEALLAWSVAGVRVQLRNAANSAFRILELASLRLENGAQILDGSGTPEGSITAGRGSVYTDTGSGTVYSKTTTSGNTGWAELGGGGGVYRDAFWYAAGSSSAANFVPWASAVTEATTTNHERLWRAPADGSISRVSLITQGNGGASVDCRIYEADGTTAASSAVTDASSTSIAAGSGTVYGWEFAFSDADVTEGSYYGVAVDPTGSLNDVAGWMEFTPS